MVLVTLLNSVVLMFMYIAEYKSHGHSDDLMYVVFFFKFSLSEVLTSVKRVIRFPKAYCVTRLKVKCKCYPRMCPTHAFANDALPLSLSYSTLE